MRVKSRGCRVPGQVANAHGNNWTQANVAQSKTIQDIGADGSLRPAFWKASELQGLFALLETGEKYTMTYAATSTCGEDVAISSPCSVLV